ncbi:hypothetical protein PRJ39_25215 [Lysobacter enzymogenes]|uniref:hypothetical protein n=1 Tax=Lysobacter enzymogenes TaxID=69 RepID=UPI00374A1301
MEPTPLTRRSSRKRVMLGRALAADAKMQEVEAFRPVEVAFVSSGRTAYVHAESAAEADGLAGFVIDLQDELARLGSMGISASVVAGAGGDTRMRSLGWQLWEQRQAMP